MRYGLYACVLLVLVGGSTGLAADRIELAQLVIAPTPQPTPQLQPQATNTTACMINCDTAAMTCLNGCVGVGGAASAAATLPGAIPNTAGSSSCNLSCTTQQLVCKQACNRTQ